MDEALLEPAYFALRVCPMAESPEWWRSARSALGGAPPAMRAILAGRTRVEVSAEEAADALDWARSLRGWDPDALAPVWIYPAAPTKA